MPIDPSDESLADRRARLMRARATDRRAQVRALTRAGADWAALPSDILVAIFSRAAASPLDDDDRPRWFDRGSTGRSSRGGSILLDGTRARLGAVPLIPTVARVCRGWREAVRADPAPLWRHVDVSFGWCRPTDGLVKKHCRAGTWRLLTHLNIADCTKLTDAAIEALAAGCPNLTHLDASGVTNNVSGEALARLGDRVEALRLDRLCPRSFGSTSKIVAGVLTPKLRHLSLAGIVGLNSQAVAAVAASCRRLTTLDLTGSGGRLGHVVLPWVTLMRECRDLRVLMLNGLGGDAGWKPKPVVGSANDPVTEFDKAARLWNAQQRVAAGSAASDGGSSGAAYPSRFNSDDYCQNVGWPELRVLHVGVLFTADSGGYRVGVSSVCGQLLRRLLWHSRRLTELDITGCSKIPVHAVDEVLGDGGAELEILRAAKTDLASDAALTDVVCPRFGASLRELELGSAVAHASAVSNSGLEAIERHCTGLEALGLAGASISDEGLGRVIQALGRSQPGGGVEETGEGASRPTQGRGLSMVDVSGCRGLERATRQAALDGTPLAILAAIRKMSDRA